MKMPCSLERRPSFAKMEPKENICRSLRLVGKRIRPIKELSSRRIEELKMRKYREFYPGDGKVQ